MNAVADFWRTGALLKAGEEEAGGAEVEELIGLDCAGAVGSVAGELGSVDGTIGSVAGIVGLVVGGGTATEVVETTGEAVALVGGAVG